MKGCCTLQSGSDTNALFSKELSRVVRVDTFNNKGDDATFFVGSGFANNVERSTELFFESTYGVESERVFVSLDSIEAESIDIFNSSSEADDTGNIGSASFETSRGFFVEGFGSTSIEYHATTKRNGAQCLEEGVFAEEHAGTSRSEKFVSGESNKVSIPVDDINWHVTDGLGGIHYHDNAWVDSANFLNNGFDRIDNTELTRPD